MYIHGYSKNVTLAKVAILSSIHILLLYINYYYYKTYMHRVAMAQEICAIYSTQVLLAIIFICTTKS